MTRGTGSNPAMHELSIASAVLNTACKHARERRVLTVGVRAGALRQVVGDSLEFYFEIVARDTVCEGAGLELTVVDARLRCSECSDEWQPSMPIFHCPHCGSAHVDVQAGEELEVDYIEVDEMEAACTGRR